MADLYSFDLSTPIPAVPLPLQPEDGDVMVDMQSLLNTLYDQLGYDYFIDYDAPPPSPWSTSDIQTILQSGNR